MKKFILPIAIASLALTNCTGLQQVANSLPAILENTSLGQTQIAAGLKEALQQGIDKQVVNLTKTDGFYNNSLVRIALPSELQKVEKTLRDVGLGSLADEGIKAINKAASAAVKEATPIFVDAITNMTISDATSILMGNKDAATQYLMKSTKTSLYNKFNPVIKSSFSKVGADKVWSNIITKYNALPLVKDINPDLTDYVTQQALSGVYTMIEKEEANIRTNSAARTSSLLKSVFALQDKK